MRPRSVLKLLYLILNIKFPAPICSQSKLTWKDVVKEALAGIGNSGRLDDIYSKRRGVCTIFKLFKIIYILSIVLPSIPAFNNLILSCGVSNIYDFPIFLNSYF